jgi:hypothetical protein
VKLEKVNVFFLLLQICWHFFKFQKENIFFLLKKEKKSCDCNIAILIFPVVKNSTWPTYTQSKIADLHTKNWLSNSLSSTNQKMQVNSKINKKKTKLNIHKIHLYATSNFNLIFHSQDIIWQLKIQYILSSKSDIILPRIVVKSKNRHYRTWSRYS